MTLRNPYERSEHDNLTDVERADLAARDASLAAEHEKARRDRDRDHGTEPAGAVAFILSAPSSEPEVVERWLARDARTGPPPAARWTANPAQGEAFAAESMAEDPDITD